MSNVFYQPDTIYVHSHEISVLDDWPPPVRELVDTLQLGRNDMIPGPSTTERLESELLADLTRLALQVSRGLLSLGGLWQKSDTIPKTMFLYPFIAEALNVIWPQEKINLDAPFALCIDPCHFQDPNARFKAPYLRADVILTTALPILTSKRLETLLHSSSDVLSAKDESNDIEGYDTLASNMDKGQGSVFRGFSRSCFSYGDLLYDRPAANEGSGSQSFYSIASSQPSSLKVLPSNPNVSPHAQLLLQQREGCVEFPLVCVAPVATIYHVIASSLLQRHTLGISDPIVGLAINRYSTIVRLVLGWYTPSADGSCVEVHVAHNYSVSAEPERSQQGVFDVSDLADAHNLLWKLRLLSLLTASLAAKAQNVFSQNEFNTRINQLQWRLDCAGECSLDDPSSFCAKVEMWRMRCARRFDPLMDLDGSWTSDVSRTSDASLSSTSNSSLLSSTNLLPEKSILLKSARPDRTELGPQEKLLKTVERTCNTRTTYFKNLLQGDEGKYPTVLHFGLAHPVSASKYAATSPSPYLMDLAPCEIMQRNRRVIIVPWPLRSTGAPMNVLKPLQDIMYYFQWVKMDESGSTKYPQIQDEYLRHQKMDDSYRSFEATLCPKLANSPPSLSSTELDDIFRDFQINFDFVVEESDSASRLDWSTAVEAEGHVHGWDTIILRILEGDTNQETFTMFEQNVRTPRNVLVDVPDSAEQFVGQASAVRLSISSQIIGANPMVVAARSASAKSLQPRHALFTETMGHSAQAYRHGVTTFLSQDMANLNSWEVNASRSALLSRYVEEPAVAKCDVISGVRVKDVFSLKDRDRSKRFSVIAEADPSPPSPPSPVTWASLHDYQTADSRTSTNPFLAFGVPDYKQVLAILVEKEEKEEKAEKLTEVEENTEVLSEDFCFQDSNVHSGITSSHPSLGNLSDSTNASSTIRIPSDIEDFFLSLVLAIFFAEHKRKQTKGWSVQGIYQGHLYLIAGIHLLAVLGIYQFPIFCLATNGKVGIILSGWGVEPEVEGGSMNVHIADHNPPRFDISRPIEALQFSLFLLHLRHVHAPKLRAKFDAVRTEFAKRWDVCDPSLNWTLLHQRQEPTQEYTDFLTQRDDEFQQAIAAVAALTAADSKTSKTGSRKRAAPDTSEETGSASKKMKNEGSKPKRVTRSSGPAL